MRWRARPAGQTARSRGEKAPPSTRRSGSSSSSLWLKPLMFRQYISQTATQSAIETLLIPNCVFSGKQNKSVNSQRSSKQQVYM